MVPHGSAIRFVRSFSGAVGIVPGDRLLLFASLAFDASVLQIFCTLESGAALLVHSDPRELSPG